MTPPWAALPLELGALTTEECALLLAAQPAVALLPVGSTEPHGPHLALDTDRLLSDECARRSALALRAKGIAAVVAPALPYGVTRYAAGFAGAITVGDEALAAFLESVCRGLRAAGFARVCVLNHHLEAPHVACVQRAVERCTSDPGGVLFANQLTRRWGRTLSDEFKRGDCHAGEYETSLVLAADPTRVRSALASALPPLSISLAATGAPGKSTFRELGMERAYTGAPAHASTAEGERLYGLLVEMVVAEVSASLA